MKIIIAALFLLAFTYPDRSPTGAKCSAIKITVREIGSEFGRFLIEKNHDNTENYDEKFFNYIQMINVWSVEHSKCAPK